MVLFVANVVGIAVLGFLVWRRGRDWRTGSTVSARWLRIAALVPLALQVTILLLFGIGEAASDEPGGAGHLLQAAATILVGILAWMRPLEGGVALFGGGALFIIIFVVGVITSAPPPESTVISPAIAILAAPQIVAGALLLLAGLLTRRATVLGAGQGK